VDLKWIEPVGYGAKQQSLWTHEASHLLDTESSDIHFHGILQNRGALAKIEAAILEWQRLTWGNAVKFAAIRHPIQLRALPSHRYFFGVDVCSRARHVRVHQSESNDGTPGTAAKIQYPLHTGLHITGYARDEVFQVMFHHPQIVPFENFGWELFKAPRIDLPDQFDELLIRFPGIRNCPCFLLRGFE
jgi:hypothetical protein